jgi:hypothetical protein
VGGHKGGMRRRHLRVPAVGGEQYRRTRTKAIHVLSRVVIIIIIIIIIIISIFWKLSLVSVNKMIGIPWKNEIVSRCPVITASELPATYTMSTVSVVGIPT